jgi:hypothetical protein
MSLEARAELLDHPLPRCVILLEQEQELGHRLVPALVELADHVGPDLARGREDGEQIASSTGGELGDEAVGGRPVDRP